MGVPMNPAVDRQQRALLGVDLIRRSKMNRQFGLSIVLGLVIGAVFGTGLGAASGNALFGLGLGALFGVFIGWFIAAAALENRKKKE
jgi:uncharacterized membrane protein